MKYVSTRGQTEAVTFKDAVLMGLATDGGLLLPDTIPDVTPHLEQWRTLHYSDLAFEVLREFTGTDIPAGDLQDLVKRSYSTFNAPDVVEIKKVGDLHVLELFHGPTLAFKDIALQFLGNLFAAILDERGIRLNVLGATSGDTGSAAIHGLRGKENLQIFIMHPHGKVSPIQERQMTTVLDDNVHNIAIKGTFDDGQRILKNLFGDLDFKRDCRLGAVNSVNWARVLAQIVYYFYAAFRVQDDTGAPGIRFCVPTGNFGNIFAGYMAARMGAPIEQLILATNENDILARFFNTGVYKLGSVVPTYSPSMDIQVASNFERYLYCSTDGDPAAVRRLMERFKRTGVIELPAADPLFAAGMGSREETLAAIATTWQDEDYLLDPHTAVGVSVAKRFADQTPTVCLATAHPAKFPDAIRQALGADMAHHPAIDAIMDKPTRCAVLPAEEDAVKSFILDTLHEVGDDN